MKSKFEMNQSSKPCTTRINALLKKAGHEFRLIRGRGYYYLADQASSDSCVASGFHGASIYVYRLDPQDFAFARRAVNDILISNRIASI